MRIRLVLALAEAIATACNGTRVTYANSKRLVTRDFLTKFSIRRDTRISASEWAYALEIAQYERITRKHDGLSSVAHPDRHRMKSVYERKCDIPSS